MYTAYVLSESERERLAKMFPPRFDEFIGHHITEQFGVPKGTEPARQPVSFRVVGEKVKEDGLQVLVVAVNNRTKRLSGTGTYHITWSLDRSKYKPVDSNEAIAKQDWESIRGFVWFDATSAVLG